MQSFGKPSVLIIGCGDIGLRVAKQLSRSHRVFALTSSPNRLQELRGVGAIPIVGNLDQPETLWRLSNLAQTVIHLAPPQNHGNRDYRTRNLLRILAQGPNTVRRLIYISTTGVYGDHQGAKVDEASPVNPQSERAKRRVDAERTLRLWAPAHGVSLTILRVPGIYAADRLPLDRLKSGTPALIPGEDAYSNHIHSDDLARLVCAAVYRGKPQRIINTCDGGETKMGDYFDEVADAFGLQRPSRLPASELQPLVSPMLWSFMRESRRVTNKRLQELKTPLRYPSVADFLKTISKNP
ncbi:NAD(P)-dependent oxidoreductase [Polynucleobacter asymbioticus]|jgi:nucleoside-diphosphate-sugar epimerase|nr:SDR family oxidoreductase [Polynucleobacter asymbioticus]APC00094.1 NAD(P)-dependent oxidoreductase [Polynucleobacter asymbioticus]APC02403.1 NAD(P)-dependent oxidoreductase [Polynucleobacter asymbioticus]APC07169.1 NAD(P)-dependent oxidoreductase [Polynucleobacter asymbioticus]